MFENLHQIILQKCFIEVSESLVPDTLHNRHFVKTRYDSLFPTHWLREEVRNRMTMG